MSFAPSPPAFPGDELRESNPDRPVAASDVLDQVDDLAQGRGDVVSLTLSVTEVPDDNELPEELSWQERALCAQTDPEAFFPEKGGSTREAKRICVGCEVRVECLDYALANDERFGIWGGLSERERRRLKRRAS
jgi:WhiB family redox-sensing transcriptional regulator